MIPGSFKRKDTLKGFLTSPRSITLNVAINLENRLGGDTGKALYPHYKALEVFPVRLFNPTVRLLVQVNVFKGGSKNIGAETLKGFPLSSGQRLQARGICNEKIHGFIVD